MSDRLRELAWGGLLALAVVLGVVFDVLAEDVRAPRADGSRSGDFAVRAVFCPPTSGGSGTVSQLSIGSWSNEAVLVGVEPGVDSGSELAEDRALTGVGTGGESTSVVGYGTPVAAGVAVAAGAPARGAGAMRCADVASTRWFFAAGSASLGSDERILLYNPFPDEAVVRLSFLTPRGLETRTSFEDLPVPAASWEAIEINEGIRVKGTVSVVVEAVRGRVVAWRELFGEPKGLPRGLQASPGATGPAARWFFPDGAIGPGAEERIYLLNPSGGEALVNITLHTADRVLQPRRLTELAIPRGSARAVSLEDFVRPPPALTGVGATVESINGVGVVAERVVYYDGKDVRGVASETGAVSPAADWLLPAASVRPSADAVALLNAGSEVAMVDIALLGAETRLAPRELQGIEVPPGMRLRLPVGSFTRGRPMLARVTSTGDIVAERFSYSSAAQDVSAVVGIPVRPSP